MSKKGMYKQTNGKEKEKKPMFHNVAPAGKPSIDPYGDIAMALFLVAVGGFCHWWAKKQLTKVLFVLMCVVAVYLAGRGILTLIKKNEDPKGNK